MIVDLGASEPVIQFLEYFTDTVSVLYTDEYGDGSGADICRPQHVQLVEEIDAGTGLIITPRYAFVETTPAGFELGVQS